MFGHQFRPHRLHSVHRCGLLLQIMYVAWSVCLYNDELCKNGGTCRHALLVCRLARPSGPYITWRSRSPIGKGNFERVRYTEYAVWMLRLRLTSCTRLQRIARSCMCMQRTSSCAAVRGDDAAFRQITLLLWTRVYYSLKKTCPSCHHADWNKSRKKYKELAQPGSPLRSDFSTANYPFRTI